MALVDIDIVVDPALFPKPVRLDSESHFDDDFADKRTSPQTLRLGEKFFVKALMEPAAEAGGQFEYPVVGNEND